MLANLSLRTEFKFHRHRPGISPNRIPTFQQNFVLCAYCKTIDLPPTLFLNWTHSDTCPTFKGMATHVGVFSYRVGASKFLWVDVVDTNRKKNLFRFLFANHSWPHINSYQTYCHLCLSFPFLYEKYFTKFYFSILKIFVSDLVELRWLILKFRDAM